MSNAKKEYSTLTVTNGDQYYLKSPNAFDLVAVGMNDNDLRVKLIQGQKEVNKYLNSNIESVEFWDGIILKPECEGSEDMCSYCIHETQTGSIEIETLYFEMEM